MKYEFPEMEQLALDFKKNQKVLTAVGDETRQYLLMIMMQSDSSGSRVIDIAENSSLSRPAISHHMQILKNAGIVKSRKEGRYIYYYLDPSASYIDNLIDLLKKVKEMVKFCPERTSEDIEEF
ncbi:MAG TPA: transcriptional regulator [Clostridium sp.]|nr:transcriptional regulator [Clostridium sp.]